MATYVYYKLPSETTQDTLVSPAPLITYSSELKYSNDTIIGYTYNITLTGYATHVADTNLSGIEGNLNQIDRIKKIFAKNGADLIVNVDGTNVMRGAGAIVRSINFDESPNYINNYVQYTIEIECDEFYLNGCELSSVTDCDSSVLHDNGTNTANNTAPKLVDIEKYKLKDFTDSWSFSIDDQLYEFDTNTTNATMKLDYTITATGKNYFIYPSNDLIPANEQARLFVQDRLHKQVKSLISGIQNAYGNIHENCNADVPHSGLYENIANSGLLKDFITPRDTGQQNFDVFNETVNCTVSEAEGSFSATYSCIIKRLLTGSTSLSQNATHKYNIQKSYDQSSANSANITVQGTVQGLIRGGLVFHNTQFELPSTGGFIRHIDTAEDKYLNAKNFFNEHVGGYADINPTMKNLLGVSYDNLLVEGISGYPSPMSYQLDHSYTEGTISYTATYNTEFSRSKSLGFTNISITRKDPTSVYREFVVPGRSAGPIIQDTGIRTNATISINIDGVRQDKQCIGSIQDLCLYQPSITNVPGLENLLVDNNPDWVISRKSFRTSPIDGSFSASLEYHCTHSQEA